MFWLRLGGARSFDAWLMMQGVGVLKGVKFVILNSTEPV